VTGSARSEKFLSPPSSTDELTKTLKARRREKENGLYIAREDVRGERVNLKILSEATVVSSVGRSIR